VIKDNPELTVRLVRGRNPLRIIVDSSLNIPVKSKVLQNLSENKTIIATIKKAVDPQFQKMVKLGAEVIPVAADKQGNVDLKKLLKILAKRNISSVLIEGGAQIITSTLINNLANRLVIVMAPKIIGKGIEAVGDLKINNLDLAKKLSFRKIKKSGEDIIIDSRLI
jgi:riboflavin-specific deaminase-like protein